MIREWCLVRGGIGGVLFRFSGEVISGSREGEEFIAAPSEVTGGATIVLDCFRSRSREADVPLRGGDVVAITEG